MQLYVCNLFSRLARDTLAYLEGLNVKGGHKYCGSSAWKKGSDGSKKYAGLSTSGRVFAGCNHMTVMAAVNMLGTGEKYAYIYLMLKRFFAAPGVHTVFGDVMCKWYPWLTSIVQKLADGPPPNPANVPILTKEELEPLDPVVAGLHALLHGWHCQVFHHDQHVLVTLKCKHSVFVFYQISNGPVFRRGIGTENGEYMELTNAYLSRFASTTKHMGEARKSLSLLFCRETGPDIAMLQARQTS
jgi:Kyakuja-Dileera-Zisupton transposase